jgi:hypothetical protein
MPDAPIPPTPPAPTPPTTSPPPPVSDDIDDDDRLSVNARRALRSVRNEHRAAVEAHRAAEAKATALQTELNTTQARLRTLDTLKRSVLEQAVNAAAAGRLADPADAMRLVDLTDVEVDDAGKLDVAKLRAKIDDLVKAKPYLANGHRPAPLPGGGGQQAPPSNTMNDLIRQAAGR